MKEFLNHFQTAIPRPYKGGVEVRVLNLDESVIKARRLIEESYSNIEIFDIHSQLRSFSVREKIK